MSRYYRRKCYWLLIFNAVLGTLALYIAMWTDWPWPFRAFQVVATLVSAFGCASLLSQRHVFRELDEMDEP